MVSPHGTAGTTELYVGRSERRLNGDQFLLGRGSFVADHDLAGMLHAAVLRSPHAHARIRRVDVARSLASPGVRLVLTGRQALELAGPIPQAMDPAGLGGHTADVRCLAADEVRYFGEAVAAVVATDERTAARALRLLEVEYEPLPAVLEVETALAPGAPKVYTSWADNVVVRRRLEHGEPERLLREAPRRLEGAIAIQRSATTPIEGRGYLATWDQLGERLTLIGTTQQPHPERLLLARALGIDEERIRVIAPNLGGAFGAKMRGQPEALLVAVLSRLAGAPVRWLESREEAFLLGAREQSQHFEVGFDDEGTLLALRVEMLTDVGALGAAPGWGMSFVSALTFPTGYRLQHLLVELTAVATNKPPWLAARGFGKEATNLVMERALDLVARDLGLDPAEVRRRNLLRKIELPYRTATGLNLDSGDYPGGLDAALDALDYEAARRERDDLRAGGGAAGIGIAFELTPESADIPGTTTSGFDTSTVRVGPSGSITVLTGVTTPGGGSDTAIVQVVADRLGVAPEAITLVQGDTDRCPYGFGHSSARATLVGGSSAALAADDVRAKLAIVAARMLEPSVRRRRRPCRRRQQRAGHRRRGSCVHPSLRGRRANRAAARVDEVLSPREHRSHTRCLRPDPALSDLLVRRTRDPRRARPRDRDRARDPTCGRTRLRDDRQSRARHRADGRSRGDGHGHRSFRTARL
jgi:aerobic carbon-monoxide dehydrogenase large subunit